MFLSLIMGSRNAIWRRKKPQPDIEQVGQQLQRLQQQFPRGRGKGIIQLDANLSSSVIKKPELIKVKK